MREKKRRTFLKGNNHRLEWLKDKEKINIFKGNSMAYSINHDVSFKVLKIILVAVISS